MGLAAASYCRLVAAQKKSLRENDLQAAGDGLDLISEAQTIQQPRQRNQRRFGICLPCSSWSSAGVLLASCEEAAGS